ncbi:MAG TPA: hypothetical protein VGL09_14260 [Methylomirabilota bacterium]
MPFGPIKDGQRRKAVIEIRGPRSRKEQSAFRTALQRLLKKHSAAIKRRPRKRG